MSAPDGQSPTPRPERSSTRKYISLLAFAIGLLLLGAAIYTVARHQGGFTSAYRSARRAPAALVALALVLPIVNIILTAVSFTIVTRRRGSVGMGEMFGLIWAASLLNQLPLRPGMLGRVAYHKEVNQISLTDSVKCMLELLACAAIGTAMMLGLVVACAYAGASAAILIGAFSALVIVLFIATLIARSWGERRKSAENARSLPVNLWRYIAAILVRFLDVTVWAVRYAVVFMIVGWSIDIRGAAAIGAAGQAAMMAPIPIGLREWVVGVSSAWMPEAYWNERSPNDGTASPAQVVDRATPGLLADVANRAAELCVLIPGGIASGIIISRRWRRTAKSRDSAAASATEG